MLIVTGTLKLSADPDETGGIREFDQMTNGTLSGQSLVDELEAEVDRLLEAAKDQLQGRFPGLTIEVETR